MNRYRIEYEEGIGFILSVVYPNGEFDTYDVAASYAAILEADKRRVSRQRENA